MSVLDWSPARQAPTTDEIGGPHVISQDGGIVQLDPREWRGFPTSSGVEPGGFQVGPSTQVQQPAPGPASTSPALTPGFDLSGLISGTIMGLPSWLVIGAAVWFLFFRKHR